MPSPSVVAGRDDGLGYQQSVGGERRAQWAVAALGQVVIHGGARALHVAEAATEGVPVVQTSPVC